MSRTFSSFAACKPSADKDAYIYKIVPCNDRTVAGITSADELFWIDGETLNANSVKRLPHPPKQVSCLAHTSDRQALVCAGGSGEIVLYDVRSQQRSKSVNVGKAVTALSVSGSDMIIGTEYVNHQAVVSVWDLRNLSSPKWQNQENHDDITAVDFHPGANNIVLAGGDDGQVSLFDTNVAEEQDSLVQGLNQGPVHKAGFLDQTSFCALSADQNLALHPIFDDTLEDPPKPIEMGDVRPLIPCEYVVDIIKIGGQASIAAGSHSKSRVDVVAIKADGTFDFQTRVTLEGTHGEDIVRSIFVSEEHNLVYTAGEDGQVQVFCDSGAPPEVTSKKSKQKKEGGRYKPY